MSRSGRQGGVRAATPVGAGGEAGPGGPTHSARARGRGARTVERAAGVGLGHAGRADALGAGGPAGKGGRRGNAGPGSSPGRGRPPHPRAAGADAHGERRGGGEHGAGRSLRPPEGPLASAGTEAACLRRWARRLCPGWPTPTLHCRGLPGPLTSRPVAVPGWHHTSDIPGVKVKCRVFLTLSKTTPRQKRRLPQTRVSRFPKAPPRIPRVSPVHPPLHFTRPCSG